MKMVKMWMPLCCWLPPRTGTERTLRRQSRLPAAVPKKPARTEILLSRIPVLAVGQNFRPDISGENGMAAYSGVTLMVTPQEGVLLTHRVDCGTVVPYAAACRRSVRVRSGRCGDRQYDSDEPGIACEACRGGET